MSNFLILIFFGFALSGNNQQLGRSMQVPAKPIDTIVSLFTNYRVELKTLDKLQENDQLNNAILNFEIKSGHKIGILNRDSIYCLFEQISFGDFNNDGIKDILIFYNYDVRGNKMYHLYLVNPKCKTIIRVKDFEDIKNPVFNLRKKCIESYVVSGRDYYTFYKINKVNKLVHLQKIIYDDHK